MYIGSLLEFKEMGETVESTGERIRWIKDARLDVNHGPAQATCYLTGSFIFSGEYQDLH